MLAADDGHVGVPFGVLEPKGRYIAERHYGGGIRVEGKVDLRSRIVIPAKSYVGNHIRVVSDGILPMLPLGRRGGDQRRRVILIPLPLFAGFAHIRYKESGAETVATVYARVRQIQVKRPLVGLQRVGRCTSIGKSHAWYGAPAKPCVVHKI